MPTLALTAAPFVVTAIASAQVPVVAPEVLVVDTRALLATAPGAREADSVLTSDLARLEAAATHAREQLLRTLAVLARRARTAPPATRRALERRADSLQATTETRLASLARRAKVRQDAVTTPFLRALHAAIDAERTSRGAHLVLDDVTGATVLAVDASLDVTDAVRRRLDAAPIPWPRTEEAAPTGGRSRPARGAPPGG
ncbi:MAG: OmpH family outer membrane protein [Gemmatimonadaceae bacterium]|jgi:Skp family chaperone for outer membrane proteins|nr:OmpH family outer membrane protein [Gemmatimonadaceae bacterium]